MLTALLITITLGAVLCIFVARYTHKVYINPAWITLKQFECTAHKSGDSFEVMFTPCEAKVFGHDYVRENYSMAVNDEGFGLKVSFPASLYSKRPPLFFPWTSIRSLERSFLTNILVKVKGRDEGFMVYAGIKGAQRLQQKWLQKRS